MRDVRLRKIRALMIVKRKLTSGLSEAMIAKEFNVSPQTVARETAFALRENLVDDLEDQLLKQLAPLALANLIKALQRTDSDESAKVALEVFKGLGVLKKPRIDRSSASEGGAGDELEYIRLKRGGGPALGGGLPSNDPPALPRVHAIEPLPAEVSPEESPEALRANDGLDWVSTAADRPPAGVVEGEEVGDPVGPVD